MTDIARGRDRQPAGSPLYVYRYVEFPKWVTGRDGPVIVQNAEEGTAGVGDTDWNAIVIASAPGHPEWEGHSVADLAARLGQKPQDAAKTVVDLEGYGAVVIIHSMHEDDVRTVMAHPTTMIGSDGIPTLAGKPHPRLYGTFAKVLGYYARDEHVLSLADAIHRLTLFPADVLSLKNRGALKPGYFADVVVFDPATIAERATYANPHRLAVGVDDVLVNGGFALKNGKPTGAHTGRFVHGRAWTGTSNGGCRSSAAAWNWAK